ncbi:RNA polymerase ECF family sigma factor [Streptococcus varani]|uniref:RNA polymerase ECF family sigma factor n=1 Tax=Streptococcus varani TaxID=1608583 RepID=A0A0E4CSF7_9STRE|nr:sigma-70 family RNA polymerase sigma factor [Streptococcus varani]CQR24591.1 RNA polymerase ECF family sigma factor [Streptococcus varani]
MNEATIRQLKKLRLFSSIIKSKRDEISELRSGILRSQQYKDEPKGSKIGNSSEQLNIRIIDKTDEIQNEISLLYQERDTIVSEIENLDDPQEALVLRLFYLNGYSWADISRELGGSPKTWQNIRKSGVNNLAKVLSKNSQISLSK